MNNVNVVVERNIKIVAGGNMARYVKRGIKSGPPMSEEGELNSPYIGRTFNHWTILKIYRKWRPKPCGMRSVLFCTVKCECGIVKDTFLYDVLHGKSRSCGCINDIATGRRSMTHGYSNSNTYSIWQGIRCRIFNDNDPAYKHYGGRGIKLCERWQKFENFLEDMGERPEGLTIDRIDVNGDYTPENCRWATYKTQARNKRVNVLFTYNGETHPLSEWAEILGTTYSYFYNRYKKYAPEDIQRSYIEFRRMHP